MVGFEGLGRNERYAETLRKQKAKREEIRMKKKSKGDWREVIKEKEKRRDVDNIINNDRNNSEKVDSIDERLREKEIRRLTSPLIYHKGLFGGPATDVEGNPVQPTSSFFSGNKYNLEPKKGILTDDEILKYAGESESASKIRLKRGIGSFSDKNRLHGNQLFWFWILSGFLGSILVQSLAIIIKLNVAFGIFLLALLTYINSTQKKNPSKSSAQANGYSFFQQSVIVVNDLGVVVTSYSSVFIICLVYHNYLIFSTIL